MNLFRIAGSRTINTNIMNACKHKHLIIRFFADMAVVANIHFLEDMSPSKYYKET